MTNEQFQYRKAHIESEYIKDKATSGKYFVITICLMVVFVLLSTLGRAQTKAEVWNYIQGCGIKHPEIVFRQAMVESGHLSSDIFKENNNLFGMKFPRKRPTFATGENRGHAKYTSWRQSIRDIALWQQIYYNGTENYYTFLKRIGYATSQTYINQIKGVDVHLFSSPTHL